MFKFSIWGEIGLALYHSHYRIYTTVKFLATATFSENSDVYFNVKLVFDNDILLPNFVFDLCKSFVCAHIHVKV